VLVLVLWLVAAVAQWVVIAGGLRGAGSRPLGASSGVTFAIAATSLGNFDGGLTDGVAAGDADEGRGELPYRGAGGCRPPTVATGEVLRTVTTAPGRAALARPGV
jgi:hypothetical protein